MSDLFQDAVPGDYITAVADVMVATPWHTFQALTRNPERMRSLLETRLARAAWSRHIWWGTSVENRRNGLPRLEILKRTNAGVPFLSVEPLLEDLGIMNLNGIAWVIVGGEAGPGACPMRPEWAESIRVQCEGQGVRFFFKQRGGVRKWLTGRELNGRTYDDMSLCRNRRLRIA